MGFKASTLRAYFSHLLILVVFATQATESQGDDQVYPFVREATQAPLQETYDYIIVGGGTAGCPLAATLSQRFKVLLLERGGSPYGNPNITRIVNFQQGLNDSEGDYAPIQAFTSTEGVANYRARVLGGGSAINAGFYARANATFIRDAQLDPDMANASYGWVEQRIVYLQRLAQYQVAIRRSLIEAGLTPDNGVTMEDVAGTKTGAAIVDDQGNRHSTADLLQDSNSKNIQVVLKATVQRILVDKRDQPASAYGVNYTDPLGRAHVALLNSSKGSQVILAAGAIGSPQLLVLSGIGPSKQLRGMGIDVIVDSPNVGKYLNDNPRNTISVPSPTPVDWSLGQVMGLLTPSGSYLDASSDSSSQTGTLLEKINGPFSLGELSLSTLNVRNNPLVTFNYFADSRDLDKCIDGIDKFERLMLSSPSFKPFRFDNQTLPSGGTVASPARSSSSMATTRNAIGNYCKQNLVTIGHYHGGCRLGKVVDADYKVMGVQGIRVVDSSVFKDSPGATPQATVMMLGRYMGLKIMDERRSRLDHSL